MARLVNSGPWSTRIIFGNGRISATRSSTRATRAPEIDVSTSMMTLSLVKSSTTFRQRIRLPPARTSCTKSMDQAAQLFLAWLGDESPDGERNLLQFMFLQRSAKRFVIDWSERARRLVAEFRAECGKGIDDPPIKGLIAMLQE